MDGEGTSGKGYKLTPSRITILRALVLHGPIDDPDGHAVRTLQAHTGHHSTQSLSSALNGLEQVRLVRRRVANQRTYRIEAVLDRLTPADRNILDLPPAAVVAPAESPSRPPRVDDGYRSLYKRYALTKPRVEVLRALLAGGAIDDPEGHATRILMERIGRGDFDGTHSVVTGLVNAGLVNAGLVRRTVRNRRVVHLEALPEPASTTQPTAPAPAPRFEARASGAATTRPPCRYVYPDHDTIEQRRGQPCGLRTWDGSDQWCWHHDPTPIPRRKAFPVRTTTP